MSRGGARPNAGRKAVNGKRVTVTARVLPETKETLREMKAEGISIGRILDRKAEDYKLRPLGCSYYGRIAHAYMHEVVTGYFFDIYAEIPSRIKMNTIPDYMANFAVYATIDQIAFRDNDATLYLYDGKNWSIIKK